MCLKFFGVLNFTGALSKFGQNLITKPPFGYFLSQQMSLTHKLHLLWPEKNIDLSTENFSFRATYNDTSIPMFLYAEIEPALPIEGIEMQSIHFHDLKFSGGALKIHSSFSKSIDLEQIDYITIKIIEPSTIHIIVNNLLITF